MIAEWLYIQYVQETTMPQCKTAWSQAASDCYYSYSRYSKSLGLRSLASAVGAVAVVKVGMQRTILVNLSVTTSSAS